MPVTIIPSGGMPVVPVESGAPALQVVESGGSPVTITDVGPPFVLEGYSPEPPMEAFTVTAGAAEFGDTGYSVGVYGSISAEPLEDYPLADIASRAGNYFQVAFTGDCLDIVSGWTPSIEGFQIGALISDWAVVEGNTTANWESIDTMVSGETYDVTWI